LKRRRASTTVDAVRALIAFDLDGVLYSSEAFLGAAYREAIAKVNAQRPGSFARVPDTREILDHVGWPVTVILERLFPTTAPAALDLLYAETLTVICAHVARGEGILFPAVPSTLAQLQRAGFLLAIASNGRRQYVETVLLAHGLVPYFTELVATDDVTSRAKVDILRIYLTRHQLSAAQLVMVGDRASDVEAASAVGCHFVGCDYGHGYRHEIEGAGAVVSAFDRLLSVIPTLPIAPPLRVG
jgi:phosphoglycolate phosphatase